MHMKPWVWLIFFGGAILVSVYLWKMNPSPSENPSAELATQLPVPGDASGMSFPPPAGKGSALPTQREKVPNPSFPQGGPDSMNRPDFTPVPNEMPEPVMPNNQGFYPEPDMEQGMENPGFVPPPPPPFPGPDGQPPDYFDGDQAPPVIEPPPPLDGSNGADF